MLPPRRRRTGFQRQRRRGGSLFDFKNPRLDVRVFFFRGRRFRRAFFSLLLAAVFLPHSASPALAPLRALLPPRRFREVSPPRQRVTCETSAVVRHGDLGEFLQRRRRGGGRRRLELIRLRRLRHALELRHLIELLHLRELRELLELLELRQRVRGGGGFGGGSVERLIRRGRRKVLRTRASRGSSKPGLKQCRGAPRRAESGRCTRHRTETRCLARHRPHSRPEPGNLGHVVIAGIAVVIAVVGFAGAVVGGFAFARGKLVAAFVFLRVARTLVINRPVRVNTNSVCVCFIHRRRSR
mmetsp:Transcript_3517/g.13006  ORF Transcript_3517/g.13006 Transcript_3517/m.13006 type:complete len:298 (-) Transcript_3517:1539-2432(-)